MTACTGGETNGSVYSRVHRSKYKNQFTEVRIRTKTGGSEPSLYCFLILLCGFDCRCMCTKIMALVTLNSASRIIFSFLNTLLGMSTYMPHNTHMQIKIRCRQNVDNRSDNLWMPSRGTVQTNRLVGAASREGSVARKPSLGGLLLSLEALADRGGGSQQSPGQSTHYARFDMRIATHCWD